MTKSLVLAIGLAGWAGAVLVAQQPVSEVPSQSRAVDLIGEVAKSFYDLGVQDGSVVVDSSSGLKRYEEFGSLQELMQNDWESVVTEVIATDPDSVTRALLLVSARALPPDSYRDFLDRMIDLTETGKMENREMKWAIFPSNPKLARAWIETWKDERTRRSVERVRELFRDEPNMMSYCDRLLSGQLQEQSIVTGKTTVVAVITVAAIALFWFLFKGRK